LGSVNTAKEKLEERNPLIHSLRFKKETVNAILRKGTNKNTDTYQAEN
jgi:hypothetical protein